MSIIPSLAAFHGESGPRLLYVGVARISGIGMVRISGTSSKNLERAGDLARNRAHVDGRLPDVGEEEGDGDFAAIVSGQLLDPRNTEENRRA